MSMLRRLGVMVVVGLWVASQASAQPGKPRAVTPVVADSFGTGAQVLLIGAAEFQHLNNRSGYEIDWLWMAISATRTRTSSASS